MRMSELLLQTRKETVAEAQLPSHRLLGRAGLVQRVASGIYSLTPLAARALHRIEAIVREEMEHVGGQEVLGMTHEEAATNLVRSMVKSYRQLPLLIFQLQTKFRDEASPRGGLVRLREFLMKDTDISVAGTHKVS